MAHLIYKPHEKETTPPPSSPNGNYSKSEIAEFSFANKLPFVTIFTRESASQIFESVIKKKILLFATKKDSEKVLTIFEQAAKLFKGKIYFFAASFLCSVMPSNQHKKAAVMATALVVAISLILLAAYCYFKQRKSGSKKQKNVYDFQFMCHH